MRPHLSALVPIMLSRYWLTIWPLARHALNGWKQLASSIPDAGLRRLALATHHDEHLNAEGAAIFATLAPWRLTPVLVRGLVAYQVLFDYLDTITEQPESSPADARRLHRALLDALDPARPAHPSDWYPPDLARHDGGYMAELVDVCRRSVTRLPTYGAVAPVALRMAKRSGEVQAINHDTPGRRSDQLRAWARDHPDLLNDLQWWEFAASASSSLGVHALLALATDTATTPGRAQEAERTYCVSLGALNTLLESLIDLPLDFETGDHSFAAYYASPTAAATRLRSIASAARAGAYGLPKPGRHMVILAGMVGFYLSTREAWLDHAEPAAAATLATVGPPTQALVRVLRLRRSL
jgi:tetraprenyl-beta-curcumene synthase